MQRIKTITLRNFKYFYGTEVESGQNNIELDGSNLLLFGENGSGKSSIYWALYTFLQSCLKVNDNDILKYFLPDSDENLRNRFADDQAISGIKVYFEDEHKVPEIREISNLNINTKQGTFIKKTIQSSDFINYKYLAKLYDFRNSQPIDLFPLFVQEILMFIDFEMEFTMHDGVLSGTSNAADWWRFISNGHRELPFNKNVVSVSSEEYRRYKNLTIPRFVEQLKTFLLRITASTNRYLLNEFKETFKIDFDVAKIKVDFNKSISARAKDGRLHEPCIPLRVYLVNENLAEEKRYVRNPHTFLNEAKLTAIALALRLAIIDDKPRLPDSSQLLVLDDLLLSLDMSHRDIVLDIIINKASEFQLLIFTHDKLFFEMARHKIKSKENERWKYIEMYADVKNQIPQPLIFQSESYLGKAKKYFTIKEYEIAGNFLRKEAEEFCKEFLPDKYKLNGEGELKNLSAMISECINFAKINGFDDSSLKDLNSHRQFVLNPYSHDSYDVPKFGSEVLKCIETLDLLRTIKLKKKVFKKEENLFFSIRTPEPNSEEWKYEIQIHDDFRTIQEVGEVPILTKGLINFKVIRNGVATVKDGSDLQHGTVSLKTVYENWYEKSDKTSPASFWEGIQFEDGRPLNAIFN